MTTLVFQFIVCSKRKHPVVCTAFSGVLVPILELISVIFFFYTSGTNLLFWKQTSNQMVVVYKSADICDTNIILTSSHSVLDIREVVFLFDEFGVSFQPSFVNYCVFTIYHRLMCTGKKTKIILSETKLYKGNSI